MIEKKFITQRIKEVQIQEYIASQLTKAGYSHTEIRRTPLGEKIIVYTTRPGLVVGKKGENIQRLTATLKKRFNMENPQIEIGEIKNPNLDCFYIVDRIVSTLERFGAKRFKSIGYHTLQHIMDAGAIGAEIIISGRGVPSSRSRSWRFSAGYLKKSGDISESYIPKANSVANLKSGSVGVKVRILTPDIVLPDKMHLKQDKEVKAEEVVEESKEKPKEELKEKPKEEPKKEIKKVKENGNNKEK